MIIDSEYNHTSFYSLSFFYLYQGISFHLLPDVPDVLKGVNQSSYCLQTFSHSFSIVEVRYAANL